MVEEYKEIKINFREPNKYFWDLGNLFFRTIGEEYSSFGINFSIFIHSGKIAKSLEGHAIF